MTRTILPKRVLLILLLSFGCLFSGCGRPADTSGLAGTYIISIAEEENSVLTDQTIEDLHIRIVLEENGNGLIYRGTERGRLTWRLNGDEITINAGRLRLRGCIEENGFELQEKNSGAFLRFVPENQKDVSQMMNAGDSPFLGDWYGWWKTENSSGDMPESWYDCCAEFVLEEDGSMKMTLWDENCSRSEPLSEVYFGIQEDSAAESLEGYFILEKIGRGEWIIPGPGTAIWLDNAEYDCDGESFRFSFYLRRWGDDWSNAPEGQRPFYYEDWYLGMIQAQKKMPDQIPWQKLEEERAA